MGLMRKRFARWTSGKLHRLSETLRKFSSKVDHWGRQGHMTCPLCGTLCHMDNIDAEEGLCFPCSPTPEAIKSSKDEPDAIVIPYGGSYVVQALNGLAHEEIKWCAGAFVGSRLTGDGTLYPGNHAQVQQVIGMLRRQDLDVELKRYT